MHTNHQRPGAIVNMKLPELQKALKEGSKDKLLIVVQEHKKATTGSARVIAKGVPARRVANYASFIRPAMRPESDLAFHNSKGKQLDHLSRRVINLAESVDIYNLPTATWSRHIAAAAVTMNDSEQTQ